LSRNRRPSVKFDEMFSQTSEVLAHLSVQPIASGSPPAITRRVAKNHESEPMTIGTGWPPTIPAGLPSVAVKGRSTTAEDGRPPAAGLGFWAALKKTDRGPSKRATAGDGNDYIWKNCQKSPFEGENLENCTKFSKRTINIHTKRQKSNISKVYYESWI
jgi:hypothetical protein